MSVADPHTEQDAPALWRDPLGLIVVAVFAAASAAVIGAIAGRAAGVIDPWALAVGGVAVVFGAVSTTVLAQRRRAAASPGVAGQSVVAALAHPAAIIDSSGRAAAANDGFEQLFPAARHAPLAALRRRLGDDAAGGDPIGRFLAALAAGQPHSEELALAGEHGAPRWRLAAAPLPNEVGAALWTFEEIAAAPSDEAEADIAPAQLAQLIDAVPVGFLHADGDGHLVQVNRLLAEWLGYGPGEIERRGLRLADLLAAPPTAAADGAHRVQLRRRDGGTMAALLHRAVRQDEAGQLHTAAVVLQAPAVEPAPPAAAPIRSEQRFQHLFETAPLGTVVLDAAGAIGEANSAWQRLVAADGGAVAGRPLADFIAADDAAKLAAWRERAAADPDHVPPLEVTLRSETAGGTPRSATLYAGGLGGGWDAGGLAVTFHETTERRSLEEQFAQSQKMQAVGQLAGGVAHDFNNLLTAMIGFCDLLLLRHSPGDQSFGDIMQIKQNANRAARLVRQLLAFSRQQTLQPRVLLVTDVLGDLTSLLRRLIGANIKLEMTHARDIGLVRVDQGQLEQVVINLAVNARDAMRDGGQLSVRTANQTVASETRRGGELVAPGDYVVIEVADTGSGIAPEHLEHIFEPFFTTKEVGAGTGLGLSTVYGIVKQTGGQIFVDSTVGHGTTFTIMIPRHVPKAAEEARRAEIAEGPAVSETTGAGTVLLVEDEDAVRLFSARALRAKGYKVLEARTGEAALELLDAIDDTIDLLVTDAVMPEMDGPTLIQAMRATRPELPILCISGYAEEAFREKLGESEDIHFLAKPFSLNQLAGKVRDVMDEARG